ncbi:unnamed protein product, partial [Onchocerca flexuosa]|uniref:UBA domain-containing protein n=1 Tax=Onchocerca flexuosa TaxID=387005 RepID=A0A183HB44_9BILA
MQNGKIPPPRPKPPNLRQITQNNVKWDANSMIASNVSNTSTLHDIDPHASHSVSKHSGIFSNSYNEDNLDPFEISKTVKDIANRDGYSQLFKDLSTSAKAISVNSLNATYQMGVKEPYSSNRPSRPATIFFNNDQPSNDKFLSPSLSGLMKSPLEIGTCYYWQPGDAKQSIPQQSSIYGSTPVLLYDSHNAPLNLSKPITNGISFSSRYANSNSVKNSSKQRNSYLSDEILGMFDPLVADRVIPDFSNVSASSLPNSDPVSAVLRNAAFADRRRCAIKLQRYNNNIEKAVKELKIEELLSMGIAQDRGQAINALQDCRWDLNAAAAAL